MSNVNSRRNGPTQGDRVMQMLQEGRTVSKLTTMPMRIGNLNEVIRRLRARLPSDKVITTDTDYDGDQLPYTVYRLRNLVSA